MADFLELAFFIMTCVGTTCIITSSSIFKPFRDFVEKRSEFLGEMTSCSMCMGFWVGVVISSISFRYPCIYAGAISSLFAYFAASFIDLLHNASYMIEAITLNNYEDSDEKG
jgi:hypothetical protein